MVLNHVTKVFSNVDSVIDLFCSIIQRKFNCFETNYEVAFLRCLCELSNIERKQIIRKHKSNSEIAANWKKEERNLKPNGPREKIRSSFKNCFEKYRPQLFKRWIALSAG